MSDNDAMKKLLYAILRQKCLKDVDWNKVAADPVLITNGKPDITNGHAARMRYSRFKKQMEGGGPSTTTRRPRATPASPRKPRERGPKKDSPSKRAKTERSASSSSHSHVKSEQIASSYHTASMAAIENPHGSHDRRQSSMYPPRAEDEIRIKHEPGMRNTLRTHSDMLMTPNPSTPGRSPSPSPSPSDHANHSFQNGMGDLELMGSFGMPVGFSPATAAYLRADDADAYSGNSFDGSERMEYGGSGGGEGSQEYGRMIDGIDMAGMWSPGLGLSHPGIDGSGGDPILFKGQEMEVGPGNVLVKTEERWEDAYRRG